MNFMEGGFMKIFVTGGTGFIGSAVVKELIAANYEVLGLARSDPSAQKLKEAGAVPIAGSLSDLPGLKKAAKESDAILHLAYDPNFRNFFKAAKADRTAISAMAEAIQGTNKPIVITCGLSGIFGKGQQGNEHEIPQASFISRTRLRAEKLLFSYTEQNVRTMVIRLPPVVHGEGDHAFTSFLINYAKKNQQVNYVGNGLNIWPAVHRFDAARLYILALENGKAGSVYHAVAEGIPVKKVATAISEKLGLPLKSVRGFESWRKLSVFSQVVSLDTPANSQWTQKELGWKAIHSDLLSDLQQDFYYS
jgi:nucleoside-diphosphate-sugar epimerase